MVGGGMTWLWWAPLGAVGLDIVEEFVYPGGFAEWDRAYRPAIRSSITPQLHFTINAMLLAFGVAVWLAGPQTQHALGVQVRSAIPREYAGMAWVALAALLCSNAAFHVVGTARSRSYSPGVVTAITLYIPLATLGCWHMLSSGQVSAAGALVGVLLGGSYHLWAAGLHAMRARRGEKRRGCPTSG